MSEAARDALLRHLRRVGDHYDVWGVVREATALHTCVEALAMPGRDLRVTAVVSVESRGFALGAAVAIELGVGFLGVRKSAGLPTGKLHETTGEDWLGRRHELYLRRADVVPGDRVLLVDDWIETGSQAAGAVSLVRRAGGDVVGISVLVDERADDTRPVGLPRVTAVLRAADLPSRS